MYLVKVMGDDVQKHKTQVVFYGDDLANDDFAHLDIVDTTDESTLSVVSLAKFDDHAVTAVLIDADTDIQTLGEFYLTHKDKLLMVVCYVKDFKDGRMFSLIRHLRQQGYANDVIVAGDYGLDQAVYYHKSGANGFIVSDDKLATLEQTLHDLKSAHFGQSVSALPMFR